MVCGLILIVLAGVLLFYNIQSDRKAQQQSAQALSRLTQEVEEKTADTSSEDTTDITQSEDSEQIEPVQVPAYVSNPEIEMPTVDIEGNAYIGWLNIPALSLSLPVMSQWSYANLKIAPCRYSGSAYLENMVIAAHNYDSHFGRIKNLAIGDEIDFTDADGNEFTYQVAEIEQLSPFEIKAMQESGYPLTLFTCTIGGSYRVAVRCKLAD
jgi:sortase A